MESHAYEDSAFLKIPLILSLPLSPSISLFNIFCFDLCPLYEEFSLLR